MYLYTLYKLKAPVELIPHGFYDDPDDIILEGDYEMFFESSLKLEEKSFQETFIKNSIPVYSLHIVWDYLSLAALFSEKLGVDFPEDADSAVSYSGYIKGRYFFEFKYGKNGKTEKVSISEEESYAYEISKKEILFIAEKMEVNYYESKKKPSFEKISRSEGYYTSDKEYVSKAVSEKILPHDFIDKWTSDLALYLE